MEYWTFYGFIAAHYLLIKWSSLKLEAKPLFCHIPEILRISGPENYKSVRWISGGSHPIFGQWASKYQARTNHRKVHARAEKFSTYHIMYVLRQNYWTFMRFVDFLSFQLISLIRRNLSIEWWKVQGHFWQHRHNSIIRWLSAGYPLDIHRS